MNDQFKNIRKAFESIKLSQEEKANMKAHIISVVIPSHFYPVTNSVPARLYSKWGIGNYGNLIIKHNKFMTALLLAIILAVGGGSSAMAENAVPGDAFYQMKVSVNEPVVGLLTLSKEGKVAWQEKLVERRLGEIQKVVAEGNFSTSTQAEIEARLNAQVDTFTAGAKELSSDKNHAIESSELAMRLESALKAHQDILEKAVEEGKVATSTEEKAKDLLSTLKENESQVKGDREEMEVHLGDTAKDGNASSTMPEVSAINKQAVAEKILDNVKAVYEGEKTGLATSTRKDIEEQLANVDKILAEGKASMALAKFGDAREKFQDVIQASNDTRVEILTGSIKGDIEESSNSGDGHDNNSRGNENINATSSARDNEDKDNKRSESSVKKEEDSKDNNATSSVEKKDEVKKDNGENYLKVEAVQKVGETEGDGKVEVDAEVKINN